MQFGQGVGVGCGHPAFEVVAVPVEHHVGEGAYVVVQARQGVGRQW
ncbi:hypothetical protein [Nonomuraea sp. SYSU D8015]|nr:hypothetical protein [Nonomuraea sp. SYSU D8015]